MNWIAFMIVLAIGLLFYSLFSTIAASYSFTNDDSAVAFATSVLLFALAALWSFA